MKFAALLFVLLLPATPAGPQKKPARVFTPSGGDACWTIPMDVDKVRAQYCFANPDGKMCCYYRVAPCEIIACRLGCLEQWEIKIDDCPPSGKTQDWL